LNLGAYFNKEQYNSLTLKELSFIARPLRYAKRVVRVQSSEQKVSDFKVWMNSVLEQASLMEDLSQIAANHGSAGEALLQYSWRKATSGEGAYCWINREVTLGEKIAYYPSVEYPLHWQL